MLPGSTNSESPAPRVGRLTPALLALAIGLVISGTAFVVLLNRGRELQAETLRSVARERAEVLRTRLLRSMEVLHGMAALFSTRPDVSRTEFRQFVAGALARQPELQALAWDARVTSDARETFESKTRADGFEPFSVVDESATGARTPSPRRSEYFPVYYLEPWAENLDAFGFDVGSESRRLEALEKARDLAVPCATAPIRLAQEKESQSGVLVFEPVYRGEPTTIDERRANLTGFAVAVFRIGRLVNASLHSLSEPGFEFGLQDEATSEEIFQGALKLKPDAPEERTVIDVAGRRWILRVQALPGLATQPGLGIAWLALGFGVAVSLLVAGYLWQSSRHAARLALSNDALRREIVERKTAEAAAESANRAKSDFLANMSHEIRTPMNAILGYAQILSRDGGLHPFQRDAIGTISSSCDHLLKIIDEILDLSRIDAGRLELAAAEFDLASLVRDLIGMFQYQCDEKKLGLRFEGTAANGPIYVNGDCGKLRQVLINLLGNAVKFTAAGRIILRVEVAHNGTWQFGVEDTGIGIEPAAQTKIFEPFQQVISGRHGGTGLGLTIAQRHVELMGGRLELESTPGRGSHFHFLLNLPPAAMQLARPSNAIRRFERLEDGCKIRALVVDEIPENREVLAIILRIVGCEVVVAENSRQALECVRHARPQIVFVDMRLGTGEGLDLARKIVQEYDTGEIKVVATSASVLSHQREEFLAAGCVDFAAKPFRAERIYSVLEEVLGARFVGNDEAESLHAGEIINLRSIELPMDLAERLSMAAELHSATVLKSCLNEVEELGPAGERLAQHLRGFLASYDMATIQRIVAQVPVKPEHEHASERDANAA